MHKEMLLPSLACAALLSLLQTGCLLERSLGCLAVKEHQWLDTTCVTFLEHIVPPAHVVDIAVVVHHPEVLCLAVDERVVVLPVVAEHGTQGVLIATCSVV